MNEVKIYWFSFSLLPLISRGFAGSAAHKGCDLLALNFGCSWWHWGCSSLKNPRGNCPLSSEPLLSGKGMRDLPWRSWDGWVTVVMLLLLPVSFHGSRGCDNQKNVMSMSHRPCPNPSGVDDQRNGAPFLQGKDERIGIVQPGRREASGWPNCSLPVPEGADRKYGEGIFARM